MCCRYVLKNLVRDWGAEGAAEREESYGRILVRLFDHFQASKCTATPAASPFDGYIVGAFMLASVPRRWRGVK